MPALCTGSPVVGEAERALLPELGHLGELLAGEPARDRGQEADGHARLARGGVAQRAQQRRRVEHRVGVGHRDHRAEAAGGGGAGAGVDVLLVLLAGRAQMHVRVEERGQQPQAPVALDQLLAPPRAVATRLERAGRAQLGEQPAADAHVVARVDAGARVEHVDVAQEQLGGRPWPADQRLYGAHAGRLPSTPAAAGSRAPRRARAARARPASSS